MLDFKVYNKLNVIESYTLIFGTIIFFTLAIISVFSIILFNPLIKFSLHIHSYDLKFE